MVYTEAMLDAVAAADAGSAFLGNQSIEADYVEQMRNLARQRLGLAGLRLAIFFENEMP